MGQRLDLHEILLQFTPHVYFQPPNGLQMYYPCIVYERDFAHTEFANDKPYDFKIRYSVMIIDREPDSDIISKVAAMPMSTYNRFFTADNLNHDVFSVYF